KSELEYKLVFAAMNQTECGGENGMHHWHVQGLYVITPSGKLLSGSNNVSDPDETLKQMKLGLAGYAKLARKERLLPKAPTRSDQVARRFHDVKAPADGLVLRVRAPGLPAPGGEREG